MRVTMIGAGYVGLVSGACFADFGHHVTCIDKDAAKIAALNRGEIPIFEPGLAELVEANVRQGRLQFAAKATGVVEADAVMIAVGTPSRRGDGHADLSFVFDAVREIAPLLSRTAILVTKSTGPVGTGDEIERILRERRPDADMQVVSNPEFLREGAAIQDFKHPDRIVISTDARIGYMPTRVWGCPTTAMWVYRLGPERAKRMLFTGDKITGAEAEKLGLVLKAVPPQQLDAEVEALALRMATVPVNQLMMQKLVVNGAIEAMGLRNTQTLATIFDGITRHSPEGLNFKKRAETVGWKEAVRDRDNGTWDWTENRPINPR